MTRNAKLPSSKLKGPIGRRAGAVVFAPGSATGWTRSRVIPYRDLPLAELRDLFQLGRDIARLACRVAKHGERYRAADHRLALAATAGARREALRAYIRATAVLLRDADEILSTLPLSAFGREQIEWCRDQLTANLEMPPSPREVARDQGLKAALWLAGPNGGWFEGASTRTTIIQRAWQIGVDRVHATMPVPSWTQAWDSRLGQLLARVPDSALAKARGAASFKTVQSSRAQYERRRREYERTRR
jgi:hypothetical protein